MEGKVFTYTHHTGKIGSMVAITAETDFAVRTDEFQNLGKELCLQVASGNMSFSGFLASSYIKDEDITINDLIKHCENELGEKVRLRHFHRFEL